MYLLSILGALLLAVVGPARAQVPELIASLVGLASESGNAMNAAAHLHAFNMLAESPQLVSNLRNLTSEVLGTARATHQMADAAATTPLSTTDQTGVCNALDGWTKAQTDLMNTAAGRHFLYAMAPQLAAPLGAALHTLGGAGAALAWSVLDLVPDCADAARAQVTAADAAAALAAGAYTSA